MTFPPQHDQPVARFHPAVHKTAPQAPERTCSLSRHKQRCEIPGQLGQARSVLCNTKARPHVAAVTSCTDGYANIRSHGREQHVMIRSSRPLVMSLTAASIIAAVTTGCSSGSQTTPAQPAPAPSTPVAYDAWYCGNSSISLMDADGAHVANDGSIVGRQLGTVLPGTELQVNGMIYGIYAVTVLATPGGNAPSGAAPITSYGLIDPAGQLSTKRCAASPGTQSPTRN
jgi:hypothetical protein